ncbi:Glycosyltransferase, GT2 family [Polaromonas sp. OV174]|nr:Glycosyltransferase, GT2 family [Polaromonas sp. OV174]
MGRPSLVNAVKSVRNQLFGDWELLVVNASGKPLLPLAEKDASTVTRLIESNSPLGRAAAANMLLDAATGKFAIFLDDDDWLLEDHLSKLVQLLESDESLGAAYSDVECVTADDTASQKRVHLFESDFDAATLQLQNYLPIHAVMFRMDCVRMAPASLFEPALQLFEDWDFWLQLAAKKPFRRVPGISAIYALNSDEGSGHSEVANMLRQTMLSVLASRQMQRWQASDVVGLMLNAVRNTNQLNHEKQKATLAQQDAERLELRLMEIGRNFDALQEYSGSQQAELNKLSELRLLHLRQLEEIYQSRSWHVTKPLRAFGRFLNQFPERLPMRFARNVYHAVAGEVARNGVMGFARRLPYYLRHHRTYLALLRSRAPARNGNVFAASPPELRDIRLHPDLTGGGPTIDVKVSVIIPTLNAGPEFAWMLRKLRAQRAVREIEIVVVDSGSRDTTVPVARNAGAKVIEIPPEEFSHSHARNLGADHATGDYVLFMVQDAYPIGNHWLYGMLRYLLDHADQGLAAASCAEYSRSDSDMMYDSMINTHYRFLGCLEYDRIGEYSGDDHMSLRSQGQLSDVSCLISRECFQQFRYRGNYAEDLDLGIRLIKSGKRVAMLASVKVIHSHNRPAYYYLKRSFVDVVFLVGLFDDFAVPYCESLPGLLAGIESTAAHVSQWLGQIETSSSQLTLTAQLDGWINESRKTFSLVGQRGASMLGDDRLDAFISTMSERYLGAATGVMDATARNEARRFSDSFLARLDHFKSFAADVYGEQDAVLRHELSDMVRKTFAAAAGSALAFYCLNHKQSEDVAHATVELIHSELAAGV